MPIYDICYLDDWGAITHKFSAACDDDNGAKVVAHAMKLPDCRQLEIWNGAMLVYRKTRDSTVRSASLRR